MAKTMKQVMSHEMVVYLLLALLGVLTLLTLVVLWLMVARPATWQRLVDKENDFWVSKGLVSASAWFRRFEKGAGQKVLVALAGLLGAAGFIALALQFWRHGHK